MPINKNREDFRFYKIWADMKTRCNNTKCKKYNLYGGRGIKVSEKWNTYQNFYDDMWNSYQQHSEIYGEKQTTLDRINPNDDYKLDNCRWATYKQQRVNVGNKANYLAINLSTKEEIEFSNLKEFAEQNGFQRQRIFEVINGKYSQHKGWAFKRLTQKER